MKKIAATAVAMMMLFQGGMLMSGCRPSENEQEQETFDYAALYRTEYSAPFAPLSSEALTSRAATDIPVSPSRGITAGIICTERTARMSR